MNKVYVDFFKTNDPNLRVADIISQVRTGTTPEDIIVLSFFTKDKYVDVDDSIYVRARDYKGCGIQIHPYIYDEETNESLCATECYMPSVPNEEADRYYENPGFYSLTLVVDGTGDHVTKVLPLKHEYRVLFIPYGIAYNSDSLQDTNLIEVKENENH